MKIIRRGATSLAFKSALLAATSTSLAISPAAAQVTTGTVRGEVDGADAGTVVSVRNLETGSSRTVRTNANGSYLISGLAPGRYEITSGDDTDEVRIQVGQNLTIDLGYDDDVDTLVVRGQRIRNEVLTSEVATNVTAEQLETLPQNSRNFLNFAQLAPGVRTSRNEFRQSFGGGAQNQNPDGDFLEAGGVNVFIDGVSLKSNVNQGGIVGGDNSRGNPFSQLAVQEFRVLTQNYKAEYEQASSAIITAVTKSGTNEFQFEAFGLYTDDGLQENDFLREERGEEKPDFMRRQYGAAVGGPIIKDKLFFFAAYEANDQDRVNLVLPGEDPDRLEATLAAGVDPQEFVGSRTSEFREDLYFGKLNWNINERQDAEFSVSYRVETDTRNFGGIDALSKATDIENDVWTVRFKHQYFADAFQNEFSADYLGSLYSPSAANPNEPGFNYEGIINFGGSASVQETEENNFTLRNNVTFNPVDIAGQHVFKAGVRLAFQNFRLLQNDRANPQYNFVLNEEQDLTDFSFPANVQFGIGDPELETDNTQFGVFVQDDWDVSPKLQLNLGLRWDVETNANNNDYVTPDDAAQALRDLEQLLIERDGSSPRFAAEDYISTGDNRDPFYGAIQPRIGFSYDVFEDRDTVIFGGYGRFFDRTLFRNAAEEALFRQVRRARIEFSEDGSPRPGSNQETVEWDPIYLTQDGLQQLLDEASVGIGELRVFLNDQKPPRSDQFTLGVRQRLGIFQSDLSVNHIRTDNDIAYFPANRSATPNDGGFIEFVPTPGGFGDVVASVDERQTRFTALYAKLDKAYTPDSGWGLNLSYTRVFRSEQRGQTFNFDDPRVAGLPFLPNYGEEKHRIVLSAIKDLPLGFRLSTLSTFATGQPPFIIDATDGFGVNVRSGNTIQPKGWNFTQVDLRLEKEFEVAGGKVTGFVEGLNVFNEDNGSFATVFRCCGDELPSRFEEFAFGGDRRSAAHRSVRWPREVLSVKRVSVASSFAPIPTLLAGLTLSAFAAFAQTATETQAGIEIQAAEPISFTDEQREAFLEELSRRTFDYFWETTDPGTCLVPDRWPSTPFSSIAAVGFAVPAYAVGAERAYVTRAQAAERTLACLRTFEALPQGPEASGVSGYKGFFYHFLDMETGLRFKQVELSTVDSALLFAGFLFAESYYDGDDPVETEIRRLASTIFSRADWRWFLRPSTGTDAANLKGSRGITMGWRPERGPETHDWIGYNEGMIVYILALGSPTHPVDEEAWTKGWAAELEEDWASFYGQEHLTFEPLFGHQYSHIFVDFRGLQDHFMAQKGIDYFENSRRAALAQKAYAEDNPRGFRGYGDGVWGLTASDGPGGTPGAAAPRFMAYAARGVSPFDSVDDGTIAPTGAAGMIPFAPVIATDALMHMRERYGEALYTPYGFKDAFNPTFARYARKSRHGTVVRGAGWVADDYLGIDQGPILLMIENHRSGLIWETLKHHPVIFRGLRRAGFEGGWLDEAETP